MFLSWYQKRINCSKFIYIERSICQVVCNNKYLIHSFNWYYGINEDSKFFKCEFGGRVSFPTSRTEPVICIPTNAKVCLISMILSNNCCCKQLTLFPSLHRMPNCVSLSRGWWRTASIFWCLQQVDQSLSIPTCHKWGPKKKDKISKGWLFIQIKIGKQIIT